MADNTFEQGRNTLAAPTNLRTTSIYATSTTVAWDAATEATSYEVWVTNTAEINPQPTKTPVAVGTTHTATNLLPDHPYRIQVYSVLDRDETHLLSTEAAEKNMTTEAIIIEDIVKSPAPGTICPLVCSPVTVEAPGIVRWSAFVVTRDFHKIKIKDRTSGTVLSQTVLERDRTSNGTLRIRNLIQLICNGVDMTIHPPSRAKCPAGVPPVSWCGSFPQGDTTPNYRIEANIDKCIVRLIAPANIANYIIEAERCTTMPKE